MTRTALIRLLLLAALAAGLLIAVSLWRGHSTADDGWQKTEGAITAVEQMDDGSWAWSLRYTPTGPNGQPAEPITQHAFGAPKAPVPGQSVALRYRTEEPVIYEILEPLDWQGE